MSKTETQALEGEGLFNEINARIRGVANILTKGVREDYPRDARDLIASHGDSEIRNGMVCRKPLANAVQWFIRKVARRAPHDKYFHLSIR